MFRDSFILEHELGWRAAGAIVRESEGPAWMRRHIITMRWQDVPNESQESARALNERPSHQTM